MKRRASRVAPRLALGLVCLLAILIRAEAQFDELINRLRKPTPIEVSFTQKEYRVEEGEGVVTLCLSVGGGIPSLTQVVISSSETSQSDSATASEDFEITNRMLELPQSPTPTIVCINHTRVIDDDLSLEGEEWFEVSFEILGGTVFGFREFELVPLDDKIRVIIIDDDVVTVELTQTNVTVGEGDGGVEVCVSVDMPTARPYPLYIQALETTPTSAEGFSDFTPEFQNVTIPLSMAGDTTCVTFSILEDKLAFEGVESFSVQLVIPDQSSDAGVVFGVNTTTVYILDNDNVTLTVEILERPQATRPIPGETVVFTCEIPSSSGLLWDSSEFSSQIVLLTAFVPVGDPVPNLDTGAIAEFITVSSDTLVSTLTFYNVTPGVLNQTEILCISADDPGIRNVEMVTLAGIPSPPINVTVEEPQSCNCLRLTWTTPLFDGDAPLINTELQLYPNITNSTSTAARTIRTANGSVEHVEVCDLVPNVVYHGSVWAVNEVGRSEGVEVELLINASVPPPTNLKVETKCVNPTLCFQGSLTFFWDSPIVELLCPVFAVHLNYSISELGFLINTTSLVLRNNVTEYTFSSIAPGRTYMATVAFENQVGLSVNNPTVSEDLLVFGRVQLQKLTRRSTILEGENALYRVRLNGPPPSGFYLNLNNVDDFTRILTPQFFFNSTIWYERQDVVVMATDDDIIRDSPYGALVSMETSSSKPEFQRAINLSLVIQDTDLATIIIVRKEAYPYPPDIPEGRWAVYLVSLPNQPTHSVTIVYHTLTPTLALSPFEMTFEPSLWNVPQELTVIAVDDDSNMASPYGSGFNLTLVSEDKNYGGQPLPDFNVTVEDNDHDAAVVSGTLTWKSSDQGRAAVLFSLTLTLDHAYYPNITASSVGVANISLPGSFQYGSADLRVIGLYGDYVIASGDVLHRFHDYDDAFSYAEYEYCCRGESLVNTKGTVFTLSVGVDLTQPTSPTLPTLPLITLTPSRASTQFFYTALHANAHPLVYYFGDSMNYRSSQGGPPQGLEISYTTGHVTWDPDHVIPGDYSVQVVVEDIFTGITTGSEVLVRVTTPSAYTPPTILTPHTSLTPPTLYTAHGSTLSTNITIHDEDSMLGLRLDPLLPLPEGAWLSPPIITGANTVVYMLLWEPIEEQIGEHLLCFTARDGHGLTSLASCLKVIVMETPREQPLLSLTGDPTSSYSQTFTRGVDQSVPIASPNSTLSSPTPLIQHMYVSIVNYLDGQYESIQVANEFSHPSLSFGRSEPQSSNVPGVVYFRGTASTSVYLEALQNLVYVNSKPRPTVGDRLITVIVFDGQSTNQIAYSTITVAIENKEPIVRVNGDSEGYSIRYFPHEGPVAAVNPDRAEIIDTDSEFIRSMTLQLHNVRNGPSEILSVTYASPETLALPIVAGATQLSVPFGTLWRGEQVPVITSTLRVDEVGVVGDLSVIIDIRHSWVGDLKIELEHDGRRELLVLNPGGQVCNRDDLVRTTFESEASSSNVRISKSSSSEGVCQFRSQGLFTSDGDLDSFRGDAIEGDWMLHVTDLLLENGNGRLFGWSLVIQPEESHAHITHPPVVPPIKVGGARSGLQARHEKQVDLDGRITELSVYVQLGVDFLAEQLYLPSLTLVHPDGTQVVLSNWNTPFCAIGNYTNLVFSDRGQSSEYTCENILNPMSGSGSGSGSASGMELSSGSSNASTPTDQVSSGMFMSGSGSGISLNNGMYLDLDAIFSLNISIPYKYSQADLLTPARPLSALRGKAAGGKWTLLLSSENRLESTLYGWSLRVAREPNIDPSFNSDTNTLLLSGDDSVSNYQNVLRSIVYDNTASEPDFSISRGVTVTVSDGQATSDPTLPSSRSFVTVHHIDIDLDPLNTTAAITPHYMVTFTEHSDPIPVLDSSNALLRDDAYNVGEYVLTVTLKGYQNLEQEGLTVNTSVTAGLQATVTRNNDSQEVVVVVMAMSPQPIERFQAVLRTIEYFNIAEEFVGLSRTVEFQVVDYQMGSFFVSEVAVTTITLEPTNDVPVLLLNSAHYLLGDQYSNMVDYTEGQGPRPLTNASAILLTDNDHDYLLSVTVNITNPQNPSNEFLQANTSGTSIVAKYNVTTYTLLLSGMDSLDNYITVLGTVTYENTVHSPGMPGTEPRQITFVPYDGTHEGAPAIALVTFTAVNDPAFGDLNGALTGTGYLATFTEERGAVSIVSQNTTLYDVDDPTLSYIEVTILNLVDAPYEVLAVMDVETSVAINDKVTEFIALRPVTSYDPTLGTLRISGLDTIREYQEVLKTLTYDNLADEPTQLTREINVTLNDSHSLSIPLEIRVKIELVNDSPYFDNFLPQVQAEIPEDVSDVFNTGVTVFEVVGLIVDDDLGAEKGMAIVGMDSENGVWQFTLDGGNWNDIAGSVSVDYALALEATVGVAIRFVPDPNWNGVVTATAVAWDTTDNSTSGSYINAQSSSNTDAFSSGTTVITISVLPVNDVPVLPETPLNLTTILEDDRTSYGDSVLSLIQNVTDFDVTEEFGIAVISADQMNGTWQFTADGGVSWAEFGEVNESSALLIQSLPEDVHRVRFVPNPDFNGVSSFRFLAWDLTRFPLEEGDPGSTGSAVLGVASGGSSSGSGSGMFGSGGLLNETFPTAPPPLPPYPSGTRSINTTMSDPITGPFSVTSTSVTIVIEPVNDSPVIQAGMTLENILEDTDPSINHGTSVETIIGGLYSDVDVPHQRGLAVVGVDVRYGNWQYTCLDPLAGNWSDFIGNVIYGQIVPRLPQPDQATLLLSSCRIRFLPNRFFNSELDTDGYPRTALPYITVHGWDNTGATAGLSGSYGNDATYASDSITNEYSSNAERVTINVTSVNNVPILRLTNQNQTEYSTVYVEDGPPVYAVGRELYLIDNDHARLRDATVTVYGSQYDVSPFQGLAFSGDGLSMIVSGSGSGSGQTSGSGSGSGSGMSPTVDPGIEYVPVVSSTPMYPPLDRIQDYVRSLPNPTPSDLYCSGLTERREQLLVDTTSPDLISEVISYCPYVLRLSANPDIAPDAHQEMFQLALRSLKYNNSIEEPEGGDRTLTFVVSDNVGLSEPVNSTVFVQLVNDPPQLDLNDLLPDVNTFVHYTEGQGSLLLSNETILRLIDHDHTHLQYARVVLTEAPDADHEVLNATVDGTNITLAFDNRTHTLTLSGNETVSTYQQVLSSVTYSNLYSDPGDPDERQREVEFFVSDGKNESVVAVAYVSFTGVNNRPYLDLNGDEPGVNYTVVFVEEKEPVTIVSENVLVHDEDNSTLAYIRVELVEPDDFMLESLSVDNVTLTRVLEQSGMSSDHVLQVITIVPNMTYDHVSGVLIISGLDTVEQYQLVLSTIKYTDLADEPTAGNRTIMFTANDGELDSDPVYTVVRIEYFNDSPFFNTSVPTVYSPLILEDETNSDGVMVPVFAYAHFADDDRRSGPVTPGIAVVDVETDHGDWEFSTDGGSTWRMIHPDTNITYSALLLDAALDSDDRVRFVPDPNFHGNASLTFVLWDQTDGMSSGATRCALSTSPTNPFSNSSRTMILRIVPVNDAPVINPSIEPNITDIQEDDVRERESLGDEVSLFLAPLTQDVDVDIGTHHFGIAVVAVDDSNGFWQFSTSAGVNWTDLTAPTESSGVVLDSRPPGVNRIRFVPDPDFNGVSWFEYKLWDRNRTWPSGTVRDTRTDPIIGTFSVDVATARLTILPVNDSPRLSGPGVLDFIPEDIDPEISTGTFVRDILSPIFSDIDGDIRGLAVVNVDRRYGNWQWSCDPLSDTNWREFRGERVQFDSVFGPVSQVAVRDPNEFKATLLSGEGDPLCRIRFVPSPNYNSDLDQDGFPRDQNDKPFIRVRAWDGTSGSSQDQGVDTTSSPDDHTNAFGLDFVKVTATVLAVNDAPVLLLNGEFPNYITEFVEPLPPQRRVVPVPIVDQEGLSLTDPDNALLAFVAINLVIYDGESEGLLLNTSGTSLNYTTDVLDEAAGPTYLVRIAPESGSRAPVEEFEAVLRTVLYENSAEEPNATDRSIRVLASDGLGFTAAQTVLAIALRNDPPQLDLAMNWPDSYRFVSYHEGQGAVDIVLDTTTLVDFDSPVLEYARVTIETAPDMEHEVLNAVSNSSIAVSRNGTELLLQGPASVEDFLAVIKTVTYNNTLSHPGNPSPLTRTIQFIVNDGVNDSIPAFVYLTFTAVNNPPFLDANGREPGTLNQVTFYEERGPVMLLSPEASLEDIDNTTLAYIQVTILNANDGASEVLFVEDVTETSAPLTERHLSVYNYRPEQRYDPDSATLTITGLGSVYEYQQVLKTLRYDNLADEPDTENRMIQFVLSDAQLNQTGVFVSIEIELVNDSPYFNSSATVFSPELDEDTHPLLNPGWSIENVVSNGLILDDDANSLQGIAIISLDVANGYWEVTWDYTTDRDEYLSSLQGSGSGMGSGMGSGAENETETGFNGLQPTSGSGFVSSVDGSGDMSDSSTMFGGSPTTATDTNSGSGSGPGSESGSSLLSGIGSAILASGSGLFGSGDEVTEAPPTTPPPPKCAPTTPTAQPTIEPTFYATWTRLPNTTSITMATVLKVEGERTRIRFIPNKDFNGQAVFGIVAWDLSNGLDNGAVTNATSKSGIDSYSSESVEVVVRVVPVNDAPLLANVTIELTSILEDDVTSPGNDVSDFLLGVSDIDTVDTVFGIAIVEADEEKGAWQFSTDGGRGWTTMNEVCPYNATVLSSDPPGQNRIRFVPNRDFNGYVSFSFLAWDLTSNEPSGTMGVVTTTSDPVTGAYSTTQAMATIFVEPVNDSPVLTPGSHLATILEDLPVAENGGTLVWDIVDGFYHDVDSPVARGIAVRGVDLRFGTWEWKCPETDLWTEFFGDFLYGVFVPPHPRPERATLLDGDCSVRFLPDLNFNTLRDLDGELRPITDLPYISVVAWDTTLGSPGEYGVDTTNHNDSILNEYSVEVENVIIHVTSINDITMATITQENNGTAYTTQYTEEQEFVRIVEPEFVSLTDFDHAKLESVRIVVSNTIDPHSERLFIDLTALTNVSGSDVNGTSPVTLDMDTNIATVTTLSRAGELITEEIQVSHHIYTGEPDSAPSTLTFSTPPGRGRVDIEAYESLLRFVVYSNFNPEPANDTRLIRFYFDDSEDVNSNVTTQVEILLLNDNTPVLANPLTEVEFVEDSAIQLSVASYNLTLTDSDHNEYFFMTNATLSLYPTPVSSEENVTVQISSSFDEYNISQTYSPEEGVLRISGRGPVLVYETILRTAVYQNTIEEPPPGVRMLTMQVFDGDHHSNIQRVMINVRLINDQVPMVTTSNSSFVFTERMHPVAISDGLVISDADSGGFLLSHVTVTIDNPLDSGYEILRVSDYGGVNSTYQGSTLLLSGPASVADFQTTLSTLSYNNMAEEPSPALRNITILVFDQNFTSDPGLIQVAIELVNDLPVISIPLHELMVNYVEGSGQVPIATNATISDNDHTHLVQLMALINNPLDQPNELLNVTIPPGVNITSDYNPESGLLILSGVASLADYQSALRSLVYENLEANPGFPDTAPRMIELLTFDGKNYSLPVQLLLTFESVNDAPMFDLNGAAPGTNHSTVFVEETDPVFLTTPDAVLFDIDNTSLAFVRVRIENLQDGDNEVLSVSSNTSEELDLAFYSYENGVLLIEGLDLTINFERAVASVTYQNLADEPSYVRRVISFTASDGLIESQVAYTNVEMIPVNDPPRLYISGGVRTAAPPVTPAPTEPPPTTTDTPTDSSSGSGLGSGDLSGSGVEPGSGLLGSGSGAFSGSGLSDSDSSGMVTSGLGSGMDTNDTTAAPPTPPQPTLDPSDILANVTMEYTGDYSIIYLENSPPVAIVDVNGTLIEDDDNGVLVRFEAVLDGVRDAGFEAIFFDSNSLSNRLVAQLFSSAPAMGGYLGDDMTCVGGSGAMRHERIDIEVTLGILDWEEVVRSLRYCHGDEHPVGGARNVTLRIQDPSLAWSESQTAVIEVVPVNDAPICTTNPHTFTIDEDTPLTIPVLMNCFDHEENLTGEAISVFSQPSLGVVTVDTATGDLVFNPALNDYGTRTFAYQACDSTMFCSNPQLVTIIINPVNDPPYPTDILNFTVVEDTPVVIALTQFFGDVEDDLIAGSNYPRAMSVESVSSTIGQVGDQNSTIMYMPNENFFGIDPLSLLVCDSVGACVNITVEAVVQSVNDLPTVAVLYPGGVSPAETVEDHVLMVDLMIREVEDRSPVDVRVLAVGNGTAFPNTSTTFTFDLVSDDLLQTTTIVYTPDQDFHGNDTITIATIDSDGGTTQAVIHVRVLYVNDPPFFGTTQLTIIEDTVGVWQLPHDLHVTDPEDTLHAGSFKIISNPSIGNLTYNYTQSSPDTYPPYGTLTYHPPEHYFTPDGKTVTFILQACDNDTFGPMLCTDVVIHITVLSDNDAPHLPPLTLTLYEDNVATVVVWGRITDVEDGRPPMSNVSLIEPLPQRGVATYDPMTGYVTFTPHLNEYGIDYIYYNACDSENHCSLFRGEIEVTVLEVNDPPVAQDFVHISREDDFDLISFIGNFYDNESMNLRIEIVEPSDGSYMSEWTTPIGGRLRVYHAHQIVTYMPPEGYVGSDSFTYSVCDNCDPRRDSELGRVDPDPQCRRQIEENAGSVLRSGSSVYITCSEARVDIVISNVNDVPVIGDVAGMAETAATIFLTPFENSIIQSDLSAPNAPDYFYRNSSRSVFDLDDQQLYLALMNNLNLTLFGLQSDSDIDEQSLNLKTLPSNGMASIVTVDNRSRISYTSNLSFSGYEEFNYEICDKQRGSMDDPRCAEATARVWVTKEGPKIVSVVADGAKLTNDVDTDSKISLGDTFTIEFSEPTNRPAHPDRPAMLNTEDIRNIFTFDPPFFIDEVTPDPLEGVWVSPSELRLRVKDEGYPVPFISKTENNVESFTEIKIGEWKLMSSNTVGPCGGFDERGNRLTGSDLSPYCLQSEDGNSFHSNSESPTLTGDFGLKLPDIGNVLVRNPILDDTGGEDQKELQPNSQIAIFLQPPLSYAQLQTYCQRDPKDMLDVDALARAVELSVVGCANVLSDGRVAEEAYSAQINAMRAAFSSTARRKREAILDDEVDSVLSRERRQTPVTVTEQPVVSEIVLRIDSIDNPSINPITNPQDFVKFIVDNFNQLTLADAVFDTLGIDQTLLVDHTTSAGAQVDPFFYFEADDDLTPSISRVVASDPDNADDVYGANDVITIFFSASTDQPRVATKADLDKIVLFNPSLGADYGGRWLSPSVLEITIIDPALGEGVIRPSVEPLNFNLTFTPNYFHTGTEVMPSNAILPTETPWCVGINVCGEETTTDNEPLTIGICSANQLSCRANQGWSNLEGSFGTGMGVPIFPWYWILVAVVVVIVIIVIIVLVVVCYRYYKRKAERKEALRVVRRWKKEQFTPGGKEEGKKEGPKPWVKPPDVATMRENPDPFNVLQKLPEVVPRPPTALTEVEHLPPVPQQPFKPRGGASIRPSLGPMGVGTPLPRISRTISGSSLPPALGLPPLTKAPDAPARAERRTTLPPLKGGGALASQARRALGDTSPPPGTGGTALPGELLPRTLPPIKLPQSPPRPSLGTTPLPRPGATPLSPIGKGKQPSTGKPVLKKSPPTSSEEDVSSSDAAAGSGSALPTLSPPFKTTRPLQPISRPSLGSGAALPPIRTPGGPPRPGLTSPITMPSRRTSVDPFAADSAPPTSPSRKTTVTLGPLEPTRPLGRALPTPLAPRAPPISPTNVTVSTSTTVTTTVKEETKKEPDDSKKSDKQPKE